MTKEQFIEQYAAHSGLTPEQLDDLGLYAWPCDCGEDGCQGWMMATAKRHPGDHAEGDR